MRRSWGIVAALSGVALAVPGAALAADQSTPAGDASASAVAAQVDGIASAGETHARSGQNDAEATGNALTLGGAPPAKQFGGTTKSADDADDHDALVDTGDTPLGRAAVTPWETHTRKPSSSTSNCRTAQGRAAIARVTLIDKKTLDVNVLQSQSDTKHCGLTSAGAGSSDGATVALGGDGGLLLTLLHSDAQSGQGGSTYLISINGNKIADDEQAGGNCAIEVPGLVGLTCLTVGGGAGSVFSDVAHVTLGDGQFTGTLVGSSGTPAAGTASVLPETIERAPSSGGATGSALARTGAAVGAFAALGLAAIALGEVVRRRAATR